MKDLSKIMALILATTMLGFMLIGCGKVEVLQEAPEAEQNQEEKSDEEVDAEDDEDMLGEVEIRTATQFGGTDPIAEVYEELLDEFRTNNPHITVADESATVSESWKAKVAADFAAGNEPDIIFTCTGVDAEIIIERGKVVPIHEIREEYPGYASNITESVFELVEEADGEKYAVPIRGFYQGLFLNKAIFEENNLELPTDWEKLIIAIDVLKETDVVPIAAALSDKPDYWVDHLILAEGGVDVHKNQDIASVKDEWVDGLGYFKTLYDLGAFPQGTNSISNELVIEMFNQGDAAMLLESNRAIGGFDNPEDITVIPVPAVPGGAKGNSDLISGFSSGWYITRQAWEDEDKRDALVDFVNKMSSTDSIAAFVESGGTPSADVGEIPGLPQIVTDGFAMQSNAKAIDVPIGSWLAKPAWDKLLTSISSIATGQSDSGNVVDEVIDLQENVLVTSQ